MNCKSRDAMRTKLFMSNPDPTSRTTVIAICAATSTLRKCGGRLVVTPGGESFSALLMPDRALTRAGTRPNRSPVTIDISAVKVSVPRSMPISAIAHTSRRRTHGRQGADTDPCDDDTEDSAEERKQEALGQELTDYSAAPGAQGRAHRHLRPAHEPTREQQPGEVGTGHQQHQRNRRFEREEPFSGPAEHGFTDRFDADAPPAMPIRVLLASRAAMMSMSDCACSMVTLVFQASRHHEEALEVGNRAGWSTASGIQ